MERPRPKIILRRATEPRPPDRTMQRLTFGLAALAVIGVAAYIVHNESEKRAAAASERAIHEIERASVEYGAKLDREQAERQAAWDAEGREALKLVLAQNAKCPSLRKWKELIGGLWKYGYKVCPSCDGTGDTERKFRDPIDPKYHLPGYRCGACIGGALKGPSLPPVK